MVIRFPKHRGKAPGKWTAAAGDDAAALIWLRDAAGTWKKGILDPLPGWSGSAAEAAAAGFELLGHFGQPGGSFDVQLFRRGEEFLAVVFLFDLVFPVALADFAALWGFLAEAGPLLAEGRRSLDD
jgi:hypothetical protein